MQAHTHAAFGLVFVILAGTVLGLLLTPAVALFACLGALLPDIDTPTSVIGKAGLPLSRSLPPPFLPEPAPGGPAAERGVQDRRGLGPGDRAPGHPAGRPRRPPPAPPD